MFTLIIVLAGIALLLLFLPGKKSGLAKTVSDTFSHSKPVSLFSQQLDEESEMLVAAYRDKATALRQKEVVEKAKSLLGE